MFLLFSQLPLMRRRRYARGGRSVRRTLRGNIKRKGPTFGPITTFLRGAGRALGGYTGLPYGADVGAFLGRTAGGLIKRVTGFGDYTVGKNTLMGMPGDPPSVENRHAGPGVVISHREYLGDVVTSDVAGEFKLDSYSVNPGVSKTFPWLCTIARNFEEYTLEGVIFEFKSTSSDALNSTNTALGSVMMATDYDANDPPYSDKYEMENSQFSNSCKPSHSCMHPIECAKNLTTFTRRYVRFDSIPSTGDLRLNDWCNFQIATQGFQGTSVNVGELWVTYQIALYKPQVSSSAETFLAARGPYTNADPLGADYVLISPENTLPMGLSNEAITFPEWVSRGTYLINVWWAAANDAVIASPTRTFVNCTPVPNMYYFGTTTTAQGANNGETSNSVNYSIFVKVTSRGAYIDFAADGTLPTGAPANVTVTVCRVPDFFTNAAV